MKKILSVLLILCLTALCLCSCGKSEEAKAVEEKINGIGEITLDKLEILEEAEKQYAFLSGEDKGDVKNYEKLQQARKDYDALKEFADKTAELEEKLGKVFTEYGISYSEIEEQYKELEGIRNSEENKNNEAYKFFDELKTKMDAFDTEAEKAKASAVSYLKGFYELKKDKEIEIKELGCIAQTSDDTTYYLFAISFTEDGAEKKVYASARFANAPSVQSMLSYAENFYADAPASEKTDALICGNIVLDLEAVKTEAAK
ncbi:MAG: hypothetical protein IJO68_05045 [Clostridia bacterium]|nr:hypothetical protein [Clostridia bacterium]